MINRIAVQINEIAVQPWVKKQIRISAKANITLYTPDTFISIEKWNKTLLFYFHQWNKKIVFIDFHHQ